MRKLYNQLNSNQQGFTLIEVMITIVILAVGIAGMGLLATTNAKYNRTANESTVAMTFAEQKLEQLIADGYENFLTVWSTGTHGPFTESPDGNRSYAYKFDVENYVDPTLGAVSDTKLVTFTIEWDAVNAGSKEIVLRTIITAK
ncbi:MAG: prepilin-type N-terminal cleavage/methylation domain-containing protein [Desulfobacterales bacterium]|nr:prepilin-type N-terminal cleavage/methylation domain-containing protein [Desulfobacterales bacterium]